MTNNVIPFPNYQSLDDVHLICLLMQYINNRQIDINSKDDELTANGPVLDCYIDENGDKRYLLREDQRSSVISLLDSYGYLPPQDDNQGGV